MKTLEREVLQRLSWSIQNSRELFLRHPLTAWRLLQERAGRKFFWQHITGADNPAFYTTNDDWKEVRKLFMKKFA
jgi:hypothetical protein